MKILVTPLRQRIYAASLTGVIVYLFNQILSQKTFNFFNFFFAIFYQNLTKNFSYLINFAPATELENQLVLIVVSVFASVLNWIRLRLNGQVPENLNIETICYYARFNLQTFFSTALDDGTMESFLKATALASALASVVFMSPKFSVIFVVNQLISQVSYKKLVEFFAQELQCRNLTEKDLEAASVMSIKLTPPSLHSKRSVEVLLERFNDPNNQFYGAFYNDEIVSFVECDGSTVRLVYTARSYQRLGIAFAILEQILEKLPHPVTLHSSPSGRRLYESLGFVVQGEAVYDKDLCYYNMIKK